MVLFEVTASSFSETLPTTVEDVIQLLLKAGVGNFDILASLTEVTCGRTYTFQVRTGSFVSLKLVIFDRFDV